MKNSGDTKKQVLSIVVFLSIFFLGVYIKLYILENYYSSLFLVGQFILLSFIFCTIYVAISIISSAKFSCIKKILISIPIILILSVICCIFFSKFHYQHPWKRRSVDILRYYTDFSIPNEKFVVKTLDGVLISGIQIKSGRKKLVIVCHGGAWSKNILGNVMLCEWLSQEFDVITYDTRGHNESKGVLSADGKTMYDLKAVIDYAKKFEYEKIGVVGHSMGGWTAIIYAAQYHDIDSIVAAGVPLRNPYQGTLVGKLNKWQMVYGKLAAKLLLGLRFSEKWNGTAPYSEIEKISPIPILLIYNENDPTADVTQKDIQSFYSKARAPKQLIILKGSGHIVESKSLQLYYESVVNWFNKTLE